jgi:hypothetical protein
MFLGTYKYCHILITAQSRTDWKGSKISGKNQFPNQFNWQSANPVTTFLPTPYQTGSAPSGVLGGTMSGTNTIYSQIIDVSKMDNVGLEVAWTGAPTGTFQVLTSCSGINFNAITFNPPLAQPSGSAGGYSVDLNQLPFKYILLKYTNSSGSGVLTVYGQNKDLN